MKKLNMSSRTLLALILFVILVAALWIPFGTLSFKKMGLVEDWTFYQTLDTSSYQNISIQANRPLTPLPWFIGYELTPDSFVGLNFVSFSLMLGKAILFYLIIRHLVPDNELFAFFTASLFIIHPADEGIFGLRYINYHASVFLYLLSNYLFILCWKRPRILTLAAMIAAQLTCLLTLEVGLLLMGLTPLILVWFEKKITRRVLLISCIWYIVPFMVGLWIISIREQLVYQMGTLSVDISENLPIHPIIHHFFRAYQRNFWGGWLEVDGERALINHVNAFVIAVLSIIILASVAFFNFKIPDESPKASVPRRYGILFFTGLIMIALGFALFLPASHRASNDRVFLFSLAGTTLSTGAFVYILSYFTPYKRTVFTVLMSFLLGAAIYGALKEHNMIINYSINQQNLLGGIVEHIPEIEDDTTILVFDPYLSLRYTFWMFGLGSTEDHLIDALQFLYHNPNIKLFLCYEDQCKLNSSEIVRSVNGRHEIYSYGEIIAFVYDQNGVDKVKLLDTLPANFIKQTPPEYNPYQHIQTSAPPPEMVHTLFTNWPLPFFEKYSPVESFEFEFDWQIGQGWYERESTDEWTGMWMSNKSAYFNILLFPTQDYYLEIDIMAAVTPQTLESLEVLVNGQPITLSHSINEIGHNLLTGIIPQSAVAIDPSRTRIEFEVDRLFSPQEEGLANDPRPLALLFDRIQVEPADLYNQTAVESFQFEFDQQIGSGWYNPEDTTAWSAMWMSSEKAYFDTRLSAAQDYRLELDILMAITPQTLESLEVRVNGQPIEVSHSVNEAGHNILTGTIPQSTVAVDANRTRIEFEVDRLFSPQELGSSDDRRPLGLLFDRVQIDQVQ